MPDRRKQNSARSRKQTWWVASFPGSSWVSGDSCSIGNRGWQSATREFDGTLHPFGPNAASLPPQMCASHIEQPSSLGGVVRVTEVSSALPHVKGMANLFAQPSAIFDKLVWISHVAQQAVGDGAGVALRD